MHDKNYTKNVHVYYKLSDWPYKQLLRKRLKGRRRERKEEKRGKKKKKKKEQEKAKENKDERVVVVVVRQARQANLYTYTV